MLGNKQFSSDYFIETVEKDGKPKKVATYIGVKYEYADEKAAKRFKIITAVLAVVMAAAFAVCGVFAFTKIAVYALVPFAFEVLTVVAFIMYAVELIALGGSLTEPQRRRTYGRARMVAIIHIALCVTAAVADAISAGIAAADVSVIGTVLFITFNLLSLAAAIVAAVTVGKIKLRTVENPDAVRIAEMQAENKRIEAEREAAYRELLREQSRAANAEHNKKKKKK